MVLKVRRVWIKSSALLLSADWREVKGDQYGETALGFAKMHHLVSW